MNMLEKANTAVDRIVNTTTLDDNGRYANMTISVAMSAYFLQRVNDQRLPEIIMHALQRVDTIPLALDVIEKLNLTQYIPTLEEMSENGNTRVRRMAKESIRRLNTTYATGYIDTLTDEINRMLS